jgi:hypothetical protein
MTALPHDNAILVPLREAAVLLRKSQRQVRRLAPKLGGVRATVGFNPEGFLIPLANMPLDAQDEWLRAHPGERAVLAIAKAAEPVPPPAPSATGAYARGTDEQRARADARAQAVLDWLAFLDVIKGKPGRTEAKEKWVERYAADHEDLGISLRSIYRWTTSYLAAGRSKDALVDGNDGSGRKDKFAIPEELEAEFRAQWYRLTKPTIAMAYEATRKLAVVRGLKMPPIDRFRRWAAARPGAEIEYYREGKLSSLRPFIPRDYSQLRAMEIIQSDHHQIDVAVSCGDPFCTTGHYPWLTAWIDVRSRMILGAEIYTTCPNSRTILRLLHRVWLERGVPDALYVDNGMDYVKAIGGWGVKHYEVGRRSWKLQQVVGWTKELTEHICGPFGTQVIHSIAFNPQSKLLERFWRTNKDSLYALYDSYRGALGERSERAEYLRRHPAELPTVSAFAVDLQYAIEQYNDRSHRGDGMDDRSPNEVFIAEGGLEARRADKAALSIIFEWQEKIGAAVQNNGIHFKHPAIGAATWYRLDPQLQAKVFGQRVNIRFHDEEPETIVVTDAAGRFLGLAVARRKAPQRGGPEVAQANRDKNAEWRQIKRELDAANPGAEERLAAARVDIDQYNRHRLRLEGVTETLPIAVAGGTVHVVDTHLSPLARQIESARLRIANPSGLSAEDLDVLNSLPAIPPEAIERQIYALDAPPPALLPIDDAPIAEELDAVEMRRRARARGEQGMCTYNVWCPHAGDFADGMCRDHWSRVNR